MAESRLILSTEVYEFARALVDNTATASLRLTMHSDDDPLPNEYFDLLLRKARQGVSIERLCFGDPEFFAHADRVHIPHPGYTFRLAQGPYRRMLLVDGTRLLHKTDRGVLYTEDLPLVSHLADFFNECWAKTQA